jgi:signal peptidase II
MQDETRTPLTTHSDPPAPHEDRGPDQTTPQTRPDHADEPGGTRPTRAGGPHVSPARRRRLFALLGAVAVLAYVSDQVTKLVALDVLADGQPRPFIGDFISFRLIGNPGAALSLGAGNTWVMTLIAAGVLVAIVFVAKDLGSRAWALALGLLLGSALGNLTDRFARPPGGGEGHVVDFLDYNGWFIGNVADIWIVGAAGLIILLALRGLGVDGRFEHDKGAPTGAPGAPEQESRTDA